MREAATVSDQSSDSPLLLQVPQVRQSTPISPTHSHRIRTTYTGNISDLWERLPRCQIRVQALCYYSRYHKSGTPPLAPQLTVTEYGLLTQAISPTYERCCHGVRSEFKLSATTQGTSSQALHPCLPNWQSQLPPQLTVTVTYTGNISDLWEGVRSEFIILRRSCWLDQLWVGFTLHFSI
jgi:hypothetical protein